MANNINSDVMKNVTQAEVNKACHSRSYATLEDVLMRVEIELIVAEEELKETEQPTKQQLFNIKIIKMNVKRLQARIGDIVDRNIKLAQRAKEQREKIDLALGIIRNRAREKNINEQLTDAKNRVSDEDLKALDPALLKFKRMHEAGISFDEQAKLLKDKETKIANEYPVDYLISNEKSSLGIDPDVTPQIEELFKPDVNGEVDL